VTRRVKLQPNPPMGERYGPPKPPGWVSPKQRARAERLAAIKVRQAEKKAEKKRKWQERQQAKRDNGVYVPSDQEMAKWRRHMAEGFVPQQNVLQIFTDGSCHPNPGPGGWGVRLMWNGGHKDVCGGSANQTNNTMELTAILEALKARKRDVPTIIYSDSQYCINCVTVWWPGWKRRGWLTSSGTPVQNRELIEEITDLITENVKFRWVKGHAGHEHNEAVDQLALQGRKRFGHLKEGGIDEQAKPQDGEAYEAGKEGEGRAGELPTLASLFNPGHKDQQEPATAGRSRPGKARFGNV